MKDQFIEYYSLPKESISKIWEDSLIVFDANVLLNLYRYNKDSCNEFIKVIEFYKERLWIPYQVGLEFHKHREEIIHKNEIAYKQLSDKVYEQLLKVVDTLSSDSSFSRHPYINMGDIKNKVSKCAISIKKSLEKQRESHPDIYENDVILDSITKLFKGRVGNDSSEDELNMLYSEGKRRYDNQIPPGYCDEKNKKNNGNRSLYGDLIVWKQTIQHCSEQKKDVIFVTDDHKHDWWDKHDGRHTPRKELIKEFMNNTNQNILIYDSSRFLEYANKNKYTKISRKTIKEVFDIKQYDIKSISDYLNESTRLMQSMSDFGLIKPNPSYEDFLLKYSDSYWQNQYKKINDVLEPISDFKHKIENLHKLMSPFDLKEKE